MNGISAAVKEKIQDIRESSLTYTTDQRRAVIAITSGALLLAGCLFVGSRGEAVEAPAVRVIEEPSQKMLLVHVAGKVRRPGVYPLVDGSRVIDALAAAGGAKKDVDLSQINLARKVNDGEQILLGIKVSGGPRNNSKNFSGTVYVNRASAAQFDSLVGIGPVLARRIIDFRSANGPFVDVADLKKVPGIGEKTFERIKNRLSL